MDLFEHSGKRDPNVAAPLAERMRPRSLDEIAGQERLLKPSSLLRKAIESDEIPSLILWGPPGSGKTTLAHVVAAESNARFVALSAVLSGVADLKRELFAAAEQRNLYSRRTILFIDEIHRFNKNQQDALLPHVEQGIVTLIGATTENPSFSVNSALLSRARVFRLETLSKESLVEVLNRALTDKERGLGNFEVNVVPETVEFIADYADGDARRALSTLELLVQTAKSKNKKSNKGPITPEHVQDALAEVTLVHDKSGEGHYNVVSAFIKSMRGSDPHAAIYWMMRMVEAGEDPLFILRRMIIFASEDIGNADPQSITIAISADAAFQRLGMPEGIFPLAQCCLYLATAPKSNASYKAWTAAQADIKTTGSLTVPMKLRNAVTGLMKAEGYSKGYVYPHDEGGFVPGETYLPEKLAGRRYYEPTQHGFEADIAERLNLLRKRNE